MPKVRKSKSNISNSVETWNMLKPMETRGQIVFARIGSAWWPGVVIEGQDCGEFLTSTPNKQWIFWYGDERISLVLLKNICPFRRNYKKILGNGASKKYKEGMQAAINDCAFQDGMDFLDKEKEKGEWAANGFLSESSKLLLSDNVKRSLEKIKQMTTRTSKNESTLEKREAFLEKAIEAISSAYDSDQPHTSRKDRTSNMNFFGKLKSGTIEIKEVCISCKNEGKEIGSQHPLFEGGICEECKEGLKTYMFIFDDDGTMMACAVCAQAGEMLVCDQVGCRRVYCVTCICELAGKNSLPIFKQLNPWHCMMCRGYDQQTDGYLVPKENWWDNVTQLFKPSISNRGMDSTGKICQKNTIKVLSLYDGISTGYYCLTLLGFKIDSYYAFEIDVNAINVSKMNFSDKITHLGDVEKFTYDQISYLCPFDLVIGGSPCNDLSAVNPNRKGLYAHDGTGRLFFEYDRVLKAVQSLSPNPVFWLYENVASMPLAYRKTINRFLNCEPSLIDAKYFSAQRRPRFYWGNIPGMSTLAEVITEGSPSLSSAIMMSCKRVAAVDKLNTVTTQRNSLKPGNQLPVLMDGTLTSIWVTELEEVFGFPRHFTDVGNLGTQQRLSLLGKSWSTQVIVNIFHSLRHFFYTEPGVAL